MKHVEDKNPVANDGMTHLHEVAKSGHIKICELILDNIQDNIMTKTQSGKTPLTFASENDHFEIARLLINFYFKKTE